jgi:multicomponent Na+:H+ antiporter subunit E
MNRGVIVLALIVPLTLLYLLYTGAVSLFEVLLGVIASIVIAVVFGDILVSSPGKLYNPIRWFWLIFYGLYYLTIIEAKAHWLVIRLIFNPSKIKPGIVRIPYSVKTDCAVTTIANSITNTPGTVTVDIDEENKKLYIHWIEVLDKSEEGARKHISEVFEKYASRIFD